MAATRPCILPRPLQQAFHPSLALKVSYLYLSSNASALNNVVASRYAEVLIVDINMLIWFHCLKNMEDKRDGKTQREHTHWNPKKVHPTSEFILVSGLYPCNCGQ